MRWRTGSLTFALLLGAAMPAFAQETYTDDGLSAQDPTIIRGCHYGEVIDSTTPAQTKARLEAAGYSAVQVLRKGCDNVWHAEGIYGGARTRVILTPEGSIAQDGK